MFQHERREGDGARCLGDVELLSSGVGLVQCHSTRCVCECSVYFVSCVWCGLVQCHSPQCVYVSVVFTSCPVGGV